MHDDDIPTQPPTFEDAADAPPEPAAGGTDTRKWVGAAIGVVAIAVAALVGTGVISSDASSGTQRGPGGNGVPPGFTGGPGQLPGGSQFGGGGPGQVPGGGFPGQAPTTPSTTAGNRT